MVGCSGYPFACIRRFVCLAAGVLAVAAGSSAAGATEPSGTPVPGRLRCYADGVEVSVIEPMYRTWTAGSVRQAAPRNGCHWEPLGLAAADALPPATDDQLARPAAEALASQAIAAPTPPARASEPAPASVVGPPAAAPDEMPMPDLVLAMPAATVGAGSAPAAAAAQVPEQADAGTVPDRRPTPGATAADRALRADRTTAGPVVQPAPVPGVEISALPAPARSQASAAAQTGPSSARAPASGTSTAPAAVALMAFDPSANARPLPAQEQPHEVRSGPAGAPSLPVAQAPGEFGSEPVSAAATAAPASVPEEAADPPPARFPDLDLALRRHLTRSTEPAPSTGGPIATADRHDEAAESEAADVVEGRSTGTAERAGAWQARPEDWPTPSLATGMQLAMLPPTAVVAPAEAVDVGIAMIQPTMAAASSDPRDARSAEDYWELPPDPPAVQAEEPAAPAPAPTSGLVAGAISIDDRVAAVVVDGSNTESDDGAQDRSAVPQPVVDEAAAVPDAAPEPATARSGSSPVGTLDAVAGPERAPAADGSAAQAGGDEPDRAGASPSVFPDEAPVAGIWVQLSSIRRADAVAEEWSRLRDEAAGILDGYDPTVVAVDLADRGTFHRIRVGPFPSDAGAAVCRALKDAGLDCMIFRD